MAMVGTARCAVRSAAKLDALSSAVVADAAARRPYQLKIKLVQVTPASAF